MEPRAAVGPAFLENVGLMMTYRCQVACRHCIVEAGPHRTERMHSAEALDWIAQIAGFEGDRVRFLSLTGGEPFVDLTSLRSVSNHAAGLGLTVSASTNGYWAESPRRAVEVLESLPKVHLVAISCDAYHLVSIPFERVRNAALAARELGRPHSVTVCTENTSREEHRNLLRRLLEFLPPEAVNTSLVFPVGRAVQGEGLRDLPMSAGPPPYACEVANSPVIFPDGRVVACIGPVIALDADHPLALGNIRTESLETILGRAEGNAILQTLRIWGPRKIIELAREAGLAGALPERYVEDGGCGACLALMESPILATFMDSLARSETYRAKVAYARAYYLNEPRMALEMGLNGAWPTGCRGGSGDERKREARLT